MEQNKLEEFAELILKAGYTLDEGTRLVKREMMRFAMKAAEGNQCRAAKIAGVHRNTVARNLKDCGLPTKRDAWRAPRKAARSIGSAGTVKFA